jgi:transposase
MRPYSEDLRERAVQRAEAGETIRSRAAALRIGPSCVSKWRKRLRETGALVPGQMGGHKPRTLVGESAEWLRARVAEGRFTTRGLTAELAARGIKTDRRAVWVLLHAEGLSFKKSGAASGAVEARDRRSTRGHIAAKRARWKAHQGRVDPRRLVFIDETWIKTNMAPLRGWGPPARRARAAWSLEDAELHCRAPTRPPGCALGHRRTDQRRPVRHRCRAGAGANPGTRRHRHPRAEGNAERYNLASHKGRRARRAIRQAGAHLLFLPPYSPDLNPIEQLFAKLKHLMRAASPRTVEATWRKAGALLDMFSPTECANYLVNSGYASK